MSDLESAEQEPTRPHTVLSVIAPQAGSSDDAESDAESDAELADDEPADDEPADDEPAEEAPYRATPIQAVPSLTVPPQSEPSQSEPSQSVPSQTVPSHVVSSQVVPSQAALFRERRRPTVVDDKAPVLADIDDLRAAWQKIKAGFIDDPRGSAAEAANVVEEATGKLLAALRARQERIRDSWDSDAADSDTESLRQAVLTYQSLFNHVTSW
jgi:hypothetical protein